MGWVRRCLPIIGLVLIVAIVAPAAVAAFVYSGVYDIGADAPHTKPVFWLISEFRDHSIQARAQSIKPPADLDSPARAATGGRIYAELCTSCHLAPGMRRTDLSKGLYPKAPQLAFGTDLTPSEQFWVIKHGVKLTAMPAWGKTHGDDEVWDLVAFLNKLTSLDPDSYQAAVGGAKPGGAKPPAK